MSSENYIVPGETGRQMPQVLDNAAPLVVRAILLGVGVLMFIWGIAGEQFRDSENALTGSFVLPLAGSLAILTTAILSERKWRPFTGWFGLALVGQAVSFQMINAGWQLRYQHYKPIGEMLESSLAIFSLAFLAFQAFSVILAGFTPLSAMVRWCREKFGTWQLLSVVGVFILSATTVSASVAFYFQEWIFAIVVQSINLITMLLVARSIPVSSLNKLRRLPEVLFGDERNKTIEPGRPDRFAAVMCVFVVLIASTLCIFSYERHPHVPDEVAYLVQARMFATGSLTVPAPSVPEGFEVFLLKVAGDKWYATPPPGWPMMLALGALIGLPWLINPLLAGFNILLAYVFLREIYSKHTARIATFFLAVSPWYLFLGMSFMTHMFSLTCALIACIGVSWARRSGNAVWAGIGGLAIGIISLVRPLEAAAMAGLLGLWSIGLGGKRLAFTGIAALILGTALTGSLGLAYNAALTENPFEFPINTYSDEHFGKNSNAYGFGPDRGMGWGLDPYPGHGPVDALVNSNLNVSTINTELFGWAIGSLLLVAVGVFLVRPKQSDYLMFAVIGTTYILHFFYYFSGGPDFAARYWFLMVVPLVVFAAKGVQILARSIEDRFTGNGIRVYIAVLLLCISSTALFLPWRAADKYHNFRGMRPDIRGLAKVYNFGRSLVLIQGSADPDYDSAFIYNPLDLTADAPIYAWDRDAETRSRLLSAYSDRNIWIVRGPSLTSHGFEVISGPLRAEDLVKKD